MENLILKWRTKKIEGKSITLIPVEERDLPEIARMRSQSKSIYFFNQGGPLTLEMQKEWFRQYLSRDNDIYWGIHTEEGKLIGTIRIYDVMGDSCEQGSLVIDEKMAMKGPYSVEALLLSAKFAFEVLNVRVIKKHVRFDNKNMISIDKRLGVTPIGEVDIRGVKYLYNELYQADLQEEKIMAVIDTWNRAKKQF